MMYDDHLLIHLAGNCSSQNIRKKVGKVSWSSILLQAKLFHQGVVAQHTAARFPGTCLQWPFSVPQFPNGTIYQQDGVPPHFASISHILRRTIPCKMDRKTITWPARSPDLIPPDFFLCRFVEDRVCRTPVRDLADLKERIYAAVNNVTTPMFHNTWAEVEYRLDVSRATNGTRIEFYVT